MDGYVAINRYALDHPALQNINRLTGWLWLIAKARWDGDNGTVSLSWSIFADNMGWNKLSAKRCIAYFAKHGMVSLKEFRGQVTVTIIDRTTFDLSEMVGNGPGFAQSTFLSGHARPVFGKGRDAIPTKIRKAVMLRDGEKCSYCADIIGPFEIDHILAVANGGTNDPDNLCVACAPCNRSKGAKPLQEWRWL